MAKPGALPPRYRVSRQNVYDNGNKATAVELAKQRLETPRLSWRQAKWRFNAGHSIERGQRLREAGERDRDADAGFLGLENNEHGRLAGF